MSSSSDGVRGAQVDIAILKSWDFGAFQEEYGTGHLPYRMDYLRQRGIVLHWNDTVHTQSWQGTKAASFLLRAESMTVPFAQTLLMSRTIRNASATIAMFESEANFLALMRRSMRRERRSPLIVITCWLADIMAGARKTRRAGYRLAYQSVDVLYYFSQNQRSLLADQLGLPDERLRHLPFGVDIEHFSPIGSPDDGYLLAVGRDKGRDWPTFFSAVRDLDVRVKVCCRPSQIADLKIPPNVEILGYVDRSRYRDLLERARAVAVLTRPTAYPSGQSVVLEAMSMGRPVVATRTPSLAEYLQDGVDCLTVPPNDPEAARQKIGEVLGDASLALTLGAAARRAVESRFSAERMWNTVSEDIFRLIGTP